tara:strand:- start:2209 stop:2490 length:282 start_codon:yes stop_codon:yes gene_type:complete
VATKAELAELLGVNPDDYKKDELQQMVDDLPSEAEEVEPVVVEAKDKKVKVYGLEDKDMVIGPYDVHIKKAVHQEVPHEVVSLLTALGIVTKG